MRKLPTPIVTTLAALLGSCAFHWEPAFDESAPPGAFDDVAIAAPDHALTFARVRDAGSEPARVILVRSYHDGTVVGVDGASLLGRPVSSPLDLYRSLGHDALARAVQEAPPGLVVTVPATALIAPLDLGDAHVAAGTNYPEHAGEAGVKEGPFLFAKLVRPTGPYADVPAGDGLLDYEVEVAFVPLAPLRADERPQTIGLVLANDYTDRETLLHAVDPWDPASGKGFTTGKSFPGFLPVGNLLVIPRDLRAFVPDLELELYVNGALRQREHARAMIWDVDEILAQTFARAPLRWEHRGAQVGLLGDREDLREDTLLVSGTPHGTAFAGVSRAQMARGLGRWLAGGWDRPIPAHAVDVYVEDARAAGIYLKPGDEVVIHVDRLGVIRNRIVP
jgi:2-keto-4-pentenoate hydratase/2-oxohepta-3-ene-1,7-dioic acid hydratase in catechol pathway